MRKFCRIMIKFFDELNDVFWMTEPGTVVSSEITISYRPNIFPVQPFEMISFSLIGEKSGFFFVVVFELKMICIHKVCLSWFD